MWQCTNLKLMSVVLRRRSRTLGRHLYSSKSSSSSTRIPILYKPESDVNDTVTLQLLSWGRGASGQLGGGIEENRLYPTPVANLVVPQSSFALSPTPGRLLGHTPRPFLDDKEGPVVEVGVSCGLFHSSLLVDGKLWIWGKGDGGRLGFGHENPAFLPTLNPHLDSVRSVALGGLHSVALSSVGEVFTWYVLVLRLNLLKNTSFAWNYCFRFQLWFYWFAICIRAVAFNSTSVICK